MTIQFHRHRTPEQYLSDNPQVWNAFRRFALEAMSSGQKIGAKAVAERLRWDHLVERKCTEEFAVNNSYVSHMARMFNAEFGEYFETRASKS